MEPKESSLFKFYMDDEPKEIVDFEHPSVTMGLKTVLKEMRNAKKIDYITVPQTKHMEHSKDWLKKNILNRYLKRNHFPKNQSKSKGSSKGSTKSSARRTRVQSNTPRRTRNQRKI